MEAAFQAVFASTGWIIADKEGLDPDITLLLTPDLTDERIRSWLLSVVEQLPDCLVLLLANGREHVRELANVGEAMALLPRAGRGLSVSPDHLHHLAETPLSRRLAGMA
ncbi:MAG TPA: hypothetical protein VK966_12885, partial [Longimicrobiales bacterium]|nr:hypothetical protein [Longimicrobiales bacterium]